MERRKRRLQRLKRMAAVLVIGFGTVALSSGSKNNHPLFRWNSLYFGSLSGSSIDSEDSHQDERYLDCKGKFLGEIQWEGKKALPEQNGESFRIAAGTKVYTIDPIFARKSGLSFCGLLLETEGGGLYFAYPFSPEGKEPKDFSEEVYAAFYPEVSGQKKQRP